MLKVALLLTVITTLLRAAHPAPPVYFVSGPSPADCSVLGPAPSPQIASHSLDLGPESQHVEFVNARRGVTCVLEQPEPGFNAFIGNDPSAWRTRMPFSRRIRFHSVYDGIDLVYYGNGAHLEYDFEIAAGAAPSQIRLSFAPGSALKISAEGDLVVSRQGDSFIQRRPEVRQGERKIAARYRIDGATGQVLIALGRYDRSRPLIVDPVLAWQTRSAAGSGVAALATDAGGNLWILSAGHYNSLYTSQKFGPAGGAGDAVVMKVDPTGAVLLYAAAIGGSGVDWGYGIAIDNAGDAFITGLTLSTDFPVTGQAFQKTQPSSTNGSAFVVKLSPQGDSLLYSTYLGGSLGSAGTAIALDSSGNAFVTGTVAAPDFPLTAGSAEDHFNTYPLGNTYALRPVSGGFLTKLNTTGSAPVYSTLVDLLPQAIVLNSSGAAYLMGDVVPNLPSTETFTLSVGDTSKDGAVVARITPDGAKADLSVFIGCLAYLNPVARLLALDSQSNIVIAGTTTCGTFPAGTSGTLQSAHAAMPGSGPGSNNDGIVVKIAADGSSVLAATFLGGGLGDQIEALVVASDDSVLVVGGTSSANFPVTPDALQPKYSGGASLVTQYLGDGFLSRLSPDLKQLQYSTYLGGVDAEYLSAMALDLPGNIYLGGLSTSPLPAVGGAFPLASPGNLWLLKLGVSTALPPVISSVSPSSAMAGSAGLVVQVSGSGFASNAVVLVNGSQRQTAFSGAASLSGTLTATDLAQSGSLALRVLNPGSGASGVFLLPVVPAAGQNPNPSVQSLLPDSLPAGSPAQNITVVGSGFQSASVASFNGAAKTTSQNPDGSLTVSLTAADLLRPATLNVTVANSAPGGGVSNAAPFVVASPVIAPQPPALSYMTSTSAAAGATAMTIQVTGSGITPTATIRWNGVPHPISINNSGYNVFTATAADLAHAGTAEITVYDNATGLESNALPFWISTSVKGVDLAWNSSNRMLYLAGANSLIVLDPSSGDVVATIPTDTPLERLEIAPDGQYLFALTQSAALRRYPLSAGAPWVGNPLAIPATGVADFAPVPGQPGSVALCTLSLIYSPCSVAIYDGVTMRPATARIPSASAARGLQFSDDGQTLFYAAGYGSAVTVSSMTVTAAGLGPAVTLGATTANTPARIFGGRIYTMSGGVFDAATLALLGSLPASANALPLVSSQALITTVSSTTGPCSLQAFDPVSLIPLWEEHGGGCASYTLFDIGNRTVAFIGGNAWIAKEPPAAPLHSVYALNSPFTATLEIGADSWAPQNELAVLSRQNTLPVVGFLLPDQPGILTINGSNGQYTTSTPGYFSFGVPSGTSPVPGRYTGKVEIPISNTSNPPLIVPYAITFANPYPLQASVSALAFTWHIGDPSPVVQSFSLTKQGQFFRAGIVGQPNPVVWLNSSFNGSGPPETVTVTAYPTSLTPGVYSTTLQIGLVNSGAPRS